MDTGDYNLKKRKNEIKSKGNPPAIFENIIQFGVYKTHNDISGLFRIFNGTLDCALPLGDSKSSGTFDLPIHHFAFNCCYSADGDIYHDHQKLLLQQPSEGNTGYRSNRRGDKDQGRIILHGNSLAENL